MHFDRWIFSALLLSAAAFAQDGGDCSALPSPLYVPGTTVARPFFARIAPRLAEGDGGYTLVYQGKGSCAALSQVTPGGPMTGTASYWARGADGGSVERTFALSPNGVTPDFGVGDVSIQTCTGAAAPVGFNGFSSFVEAFGFIVPPNSTQTAITAEEAYFIFKFGAQPSRTVPPWTDPNVIVIRNPSSSTQLTVGANIGVPGTLWSPALVNQNAGGGNVLTKVAAENTTGNAEKTLGILATDAWDPARDRVRMLAFQAFNQSCLGAVLPDTSLTSFDKRNVRDGHYPIWGNFWAYTAVDSTGQPVNANVKRLIAFFAGEPLNGADPIVDVARTGNVPVCAMKVSRAYDGAPLTPFAPAAPCGCFFDSLVSTTSCTACPAGTCATGVCRRGFCEER